MTSAIIVETKEENIKHIKGEMIDIHVQEKMMKRFKDFKNPTFKLISFDLYTVDGQMEKIDNEDYERIDTKEYWHFTVEFNNKQYETRVELWASSGGGSFFVELKLNDEWVASEEKLGKELNELCDDIYSFFHCKDLEGVICIYNFLN